MFVRKSEALQLQAVYNESNISDLKREWKSIVSENKGFCESASCPFTPQTSFDYDPENFLYYRARAITADVPNGNGDLFPFEEIDKSYKTFIGKGIYLNHDNDSPDKAFGIILDAVFHRDAKYVEILGAIDKELAEEKHPGLIRKVTSGIINSTSMSCLVNEAECGVCHNRAHNEAELCAHMHPKSPNYIKGKRATDGSLHYEINYGITFTEDSLVNVPADSSCHVFQVWGSLKNSGKLISHFEKYWARKGELMKPSLSISDTGITKGAQKESETQDAKVIESLESLDEIVSKEIERKIDTQIKRTIEDEIRKTLGKVFTDLEKSIRPEIEKEVTEQAKTVEEEIKEIVPAVKEVEEKSEKIKTESSIRDVVEMITFLRSAEPDAKEYRSFVSKFIKEYRTKHPDVSVTEAMKEAAKAWRAKKKPKKEDTLKTSAEVKILEPKSIDLGEGVTISPIDEKRGRIYIGGKDTHLDIELKPELDEEEQKLFYKAQLENVLTELAKTELLKLEEPTVEKLSEITEVSSSLEEGRKMFKVEYREGKSFDTSYFVGTDGERIKIVNAARVIPAEIQKRIIDAMSKGQSVEDIISPEEAEKQIEKVCGGTFEGFVEWANQLPPMQRTSSLKKDAEWAINEAEIPKVEMPAKGEVFTSICEDEVQESKDFTTLPSDRTSKVRQYYSRLPGSSVGPQDQAINLQSIVNQKYQLLKKALEEEKEKSQKLMKEKEEVVKEMEKLKEEKEIDKTKVLIDSILSEIKKITTLEPDKEKEIVDLLVKLGGKSLGILLEIVKSLATEMPKTPKTASISGINLPGMIQPPEQSASLIEVVSKMFDHN
ncbi:MAG: hypothetical protein QXD72_02405 [Candidatus Aenigmatarchaeota archaeon]